MTGSLPPGDPGASATLHLVSWRDPAVVALALLALASGFGQFGALAALGDVAKHFGHATGGATLADEAGLSGTRLGVGLAVIRGASLLALPLSAAADRYGRRRTMLATTGLGLALTVVAALSPGYWWFVAIFAAGRPLLSATNALTQVAAAEETASRDRAKAVALVSAGYAAGAGLTAVLHSLADKALGFRGLFALAVIPLAGLPLLARQVRETDRFTVSTSRAERTMPVLGPVGRPYRRRLLVLSAAFFFVSVVTGPANSFAFLYAQNVLHLSGVVVAVMVVVAGVVGVVALLLGRLAADRLGRRPACAGAFVAIAVTAMIAYSGSKPAYLIGYVLGVVSGGLIAPGLGALVNELFPTAVRASVAGWQVAAGVVGAVVGLVGFGAVADVGNRFGFGAVVVFAPATLAAGLFFLVPETRGREPEDLWPDAVSGPGAPSP